MKTGRVVPQARVDSLAAGLFVVLAAAAQAAWAQAAAAATPSTQSAAVSLENSSEAGAAPEIRTVSARFALWSRPACAIPSSPQEVDSCRPPRALGVEWRAEFRYVEPSNGRDVVADQVFSSPPWKARVQIVYVRPPQPEIPYLAVQTQLEHADLGPLGGCVRYEDARTARALTPGACSGVSGGVEYGLTTFRP